MQSIHSATQSNNQVTALFVDRALSFNLSKGATFADLANCLDRPHFHAWQAGIPTAIYLKFAKVHVRRPVTTGTATAS